MKKLMLLLTIAVYSQVSIAQTDEIAPLQNIDSVITEKITSLEERLNQYEAELASLKKENAALKKQIETIKTETTRRPIARKFSVSRKGSKQVVVE